MQGVKCRFCPVCDGFGCTGELPGMGGIRGNINFRLNCSAWDCLPALQNGILPAVRLAPITGAVENVGYPEETPFYADLLTGAYEAGCRLSIGDGCPDIKLLAGISALVSLGADAAVFIKPYENRRVLERLDWSSRVAEIAGIDIDAYNIVTMRNKVNLEKKTAAQLREIKRSLFVPFAIKGIFTREDIELVKEVRPDIAVVSNHGGRVENSAGSTAEFLAAHAAELRRYCGQIWVDGGIRKRRDLQAAAYFGVSEVMIGRPLISALCRDGSDGIQKLMGKTFALATQKEVFAAAAF